MFLKKGEHRKRVRWNRRLTHLCTFCIGVSRKFHLQFTLYTYVLSKSFQDGAKFKQKLTPGFKNHMKNLDNFRKAVESPKSWNPMGYVCQKSTFLQLKHYIQRIYLTLLSTNYVKIHQIPYIGHFWNHKLFFTAQLVCIILVQMLHTFDKNIPSKFKFCSS